MDGKSDAAWSEDHSFGTKYKLILKSLGQSSLHALLVTCQNPGECS